MLSEAWLGPRTVRVSGADVVSLCRDRLKEQAAHYAVDLVRPGMIVGLGHGSTAAHALLRIAELYAAGRLEGILAVPCSDQVEREARELGIPLSSLDRHPVVDLTIDGADEVDSSLDLIKGGGGALLREKIVAQASRREVIVVDDSKLSPVLGTHWVVPVEVVPFGWASQAAYVSSIGADVVLRLDQDGEPLVTDQGNYLLDSGFGPIGDAGELAARLDRRTGIVAHGLFLGLATDVIVARPTGIQHLRRTPRKDSEE
jgi:ribose 5-phosphate isomerase A